MNIKQRIANLKGRIFNRLTDIKEVCDICTDIEERVDTLEQNAGKGYKEFAGIFYVNYTLNDPTAIITPDVVMQNDFEGPITFRVRTVDSLGGFVVIDAITGLDYVFSRSGSPANAYEKIFFTPFATPSGTVVGGGYELLQYGNGTGGITEAEGEFTIYLSGYASYNSAIGLSDTFGIYFRVYD